MLAWIALEFGLSTKRTRIRRLLSWLHGLRLQSYHVPIKFTSDEEPIPKRLEYQRNPQIRIINCQLSKQKTQKKNPLFVLPFAFLHIGSRFNSQKFLEFFHSRNSKTTK